MINENIPKVKLLEEYLLDLLKDKKANFDYRINLEPI